MKRSLVLLLMLVGLTTVSVRAELKYTTRAEVHKVAGGAPDDPSIARIAESARTVFDRYAAGTRECTNILGDRGLRVECVSPTGTPSGRVVIFYPDGTGVVVDTVSRHYMTMDRRGVSAASATLGPTATTARMGETAVIAGTDTDRTTFDVTMHPANVPSERQSSLVSMLSLAGETWLAAKYRSYGLLLGRSYVDAPLSLSGLAPTEKEGFAMRTVVRGALLGGYELERVVTSVSEEAVSAELFTVPAGYPRVYPPGGGVILPRLVKQVPPRYTQNAMRNKIEGAVTLEAVVGSDGSVVSARVVKSLDADFGLDLEAVAAARQWQFTPGTLNGTAVPVLVTLVLTFRLH